MDDKKAIRTSIFDDVFMTMFERMPELFIPLINEAFGTDYSNGDKIVKLRDEHHFSENKIITDSFIGIRDSRYHFECQSKDDSCMIIRMFEYDTAIALESLESVEDGVTEIKETLRVRFPNGFVYFYHPEVLEVSAYSLDELFERNLLVFLPFYMIRYEKTIKEDNTESEEFKKLLKETIELIDRLDVFRESFETDMVDLIEHIADYLFRSSKNTRERMDGVMRGKVLKLKSEILMEEGEARGVSKVKQKHWRDWYRTVSSTQKQQQNAWE